MLRPRYLCAVPAVLATLLAPAHAVADRVQSQPVTPGAASRAVPALPLAFEPAPHAPGAFVARTSRYAVALDSAAMTVRLGASEVQVRFVDGEPGRYVGERSFAQAHYLVGPQSDWRTGVPLFERVRRQDLWPGIDAVFYGNDRLVEYDFIVAPGRDPRAIALDVAGADAVSVSDAGDLVIVTSDETLVQRRPIAYQVVDGHRVPVAAAYRLDGRRVAFDLGAYDRTRELVIDPILVFGTYLGGSGLEFWQGSSVAGIAIDAQDRLVVTGDTFMPNWGANIRDLRAGGGGQREVFVAILSRDGTTLHSLTYLGGNAQDDRASLSFLPNGSIVVAGRTLSSNLPVTQSIGRAYAGNLDGFLYVLNENASLILFCTYLGGSGDDSINAVTVDSSARVVVAGLTASSHDSTTPFPTAGAGADTTYGGGERDAFVAAFDPTNGSLAFSTYIGGNGADAAQAVEASNSHVFVAGSSRSGDLTFTNGPQATLRGSSDAFIAVINPATGARVAGTFWGGTQTHDTQTPDEVINDLALRGTSLYAVGATNSVDLPTQSAVQAAAGGGPGVLDGFAARFTWNGTTLALNYSTYLGGAGNDSAFGVAVDTNGAAYITGATQSPSFPPNVRAYDTTLGGSQDAFLVILPQAGTPIVGTTYYGGTAIDTGLEIALDANRDVYIVGQTTSSDLPTRSAYDYTHNGAEDAFVVRLTDADTDGDGLPNFWETDNNLSPTDATGDNGANGDPDRDLIPNSAEYLGETDPRMAVRYFAEGATGTAINFDTRFAIFNPHPDVTMDVTFDFLTSDQRTFTHVMQGLGPGERRTLDARNVPGVPELAAAEFSTVVRSQFGLVADRTMSWNATGYGSHAETSILSPSRIWYLAEGATHSDFELFYLLQNPGGTTAQVRVTYLRPSPKTPLIKTYQVAPLSRFNIWVNLEGFPDAAGPQLLADEEFSAVVEVIDGPEIIVERAMYQNRGGQLFAAGHNSAGVTAPSTRWFLAEGASGPYFDLFYLLANPSDSAVNARITYLLENGQTIERTYCVSGCTYGPLGPRSRTTVWVDFEDAVFGGPTTTGVSAIVEASSGIIVERAMWWPGTPDRWLEAHNSPGTTTTGRRWALAEGEVGGPRSTETYVLIANTSNAPGQARVTLFFEGGTSESKIVDLSASSRRTLDIAFEFPQAVGKRFGTLIEALAVANGPVPAIVVERAMYSADTNRPSFQPYWPAGTNAVGTVVGSVQQPQ